MNAHKPERTLKHSHRHPDHTPLSRNNEPDTPKLPRRGDTSMAA